MCAHYLSFIFSPRNLFWCLSLSLLLETVPILTTEGETEILYPNYHGCKLLKILCRYVKCSFLPATDSHHSFLPLHLQP